MSGVIAIVRYLGIDFGTKRIGLAVSDAGGAIASPLEVVERRGDIGQLTAHLLAIADEYGASAFVLGIPLNMDGTEGPQAKLTRQFAQQLTMASNRPVHEWDERLSSRGADTLLAGTNLTHKRRKARHDAVAAQIILQSFLDAQHSPPAAPDA